MSQAQLVEDVRDNDDHLGLFHSLTQTVFGFDLEQWRRNGYWSDKYVPHALLAGGDMLSNVSTYQMRLMLDGEEKRTVQVGTVMTHPDHRGKGYASDLMEHVVTRYSSETDLMFLFCASDTAGFYEKYGFKVVKEHRFTADMTGVEPRPESLKRLKLRDPKIREWLYQRAAARRPVSRRFGILDGSEIFMYHSLCRYPACVFHYERQDCLIIAREVDGVLHVYDIVSAGSVYITELLGFFVAYGITEAEFHFTPDELAIPTASQVIQSDEVFMVRADTFPVNGEFRHPTTLEA